MAPVQYPCPCAATGDRRAHRRRSSKPIRDLSQVGPHVGVQACSIETVVHHGIAYNNLQTSNLRPLAILVLHAAIIEIRMMVIVMGAFIRTLYSNNCPAARPSSSRHLAPGQQRPTYWHTQLSSTSKCHWQVSRDTAPSTSTVQPLLHLT
jgi:hypothetical protein